MRDFQVALYIHKSRSFFVVLEQGKNLEAMLAVRLASCNIHDLAREAQPLGQAGLVGVDNPAGEVGEPIFHAHLRRKLRPVEPQLAVCPAAE